MSDGHAQLPDVEGAGVVREVAKLELGKPSRCGEGYQVFLAFAHRSRDSPNSKRGTRAPITVPSRSISWKSILADAELAARVRGTRTRPCPPRGATATGDTARRRSSAAAPAAPPCRHTALPPEPPAYASKPPAPAVEPPTRLCPSCLRRSQHRNRRAPNAPPAFGPSAVKLRSCAPVIHWHPAAQRASVHAQPRTIDAPANQCRSLLVPSACARSPAKPPLADTEWLDQGFARDGIPTEEAYSSISAFRQRCPLPRLACNPERV